MLQRLILPHCNHFTVVSPTNSPQCIFKTCPFFNNLLSVSEDTAVLCRELPAANETRIFPTFLWIGFERKAQTPLSELLEVLLVAKTRAAIPSHIPKSLAEENRMLDFREEQEYFALRIQS